MPRGYNCSTYRLHVYGTLCGQPVDKKYCSTNEFLREFGGDKTPMELNKFKLHRLRKKWGPHQKKEGCGRDCTDDFIKKNYGLIFDSIKETREKTVSVVKSTTFLS